MADIVTSRVFTDGERGITAAKLNDIVGSSAIQPAFYTAKPTASSLGPTDVMLAVKAGAYVQTPFQTVVDSVSSAISSDAEIWSVRLRSFNAVGNPTHEIDSRNAASGLTNPANAVFLMDRRLLIKQVSTLAFNCGQINNVPQVVPGTNFRITNSILNFTMTAQQASMAAGDFYGIATHVEGPSFREISGDVHSLSLLVRCDQAPLKFAVSIRDSPATKSLVKLCTLSNTGWNLIQLPNLPVFPSGNFSLLPGNPGYTITVCIACGATNTGIADTWQGGSFVGAAGMDNIGSKPVNTSFQLAFLQHEPGPVCSTPIDKPWRQNFDECLRFFAKSYDLSVKPGTVSSGGNVVQWMPVASGSVIGNNPFPRPMAKTPTITYYSPTTGASASVRDGVAAVDRVVSNPFGVGTTGQAGPICATNFAAGSYALYHWVADSGW